MYSRLWHRHVNNRKHKNFPSFVFIETLGIINRKEKQKYIVSRKAHWYRLLKSIQFMVIIMKRKQRRYRWVTGIACTKEKESLFLFMPQRLLEKFWWSFFKERARHNVYWKRKFWEEVVKFYSCFWTISGCTGFFKKSG